MLSMVQGGVVTGQVNSGLAASESGEEAYVCLGRARRNYVRHMKRFVYLTACSPVRPSATGINFFFADQL